ICKPLFSIKKWWDKYSRDTLLRLQEFDKLRTDTYQICLSGDSRNIDLYAELERKHPDLAKLVRDRGINGVFTSPPYVGLIDYHEQHAYAYELFGLERKDELEIGPLFRGSGMEARKSYVEGIARVLLHIKPYLIEDFNVFIVANDKFNLYPSIAEKAGMKIVNQFKRPVLNRTEKDKGAYSETIFHLKSADK
ncbi:MAG: site-specific DNA-methyltransferase, partial [Methanobacteriota archaeon]